MAKLFIVPTPIGNLEDITLRALNVLKAADLILCEDTRTTKNLLQHYEIEGKRCMAYHIFNEHEQVGNYIRQIQQVETAALVSDAGTPGISDPGFLLVREALKQDVEVECLPGATALVPALVQSGFPCSSFYFFGFLPHKKGKETLLKRFAEMEETVVFYESPHRLLKTLEKMSFTFRGTLEEALQHFGNQPVKGEFVLIV